MGFRFRRSVKVLPGVRLNLSKSGVSATIGKKGASLNIGHGNQTVSLGIPGTGLSYRTSQSFAAVSPSGGLETHGLVSSIGTGDGAPDEPTKVYSTSEETAYRIVAWLAAMTMAGADIDQVTERIAGQLPEWLPNGMSGATYSKVLVLQMQRESMRQRGTSAVRRTLQKMGLQDATFTAEAVAAVKASAKARMGSQADARLPVEWYRKDGQLLSREYEAPSVRSRMTDDALAEVHSKVHELGKLRLANPALEKSRKSSLKLPELKLEPVTWMLIYVMAFTVLFLAFCVLGLIWGGLTWNATHPQ